MLKRDFGILFLAACAVFLSIQNEGPFTFEKAWCEDILFRCYLDNLDHLSWEVSLKQYLFFLYRYHHFSSSDIENLDITAYNNLPPPVSVRTYFFNCFCCSRPLSDHFLDALFSY